MTIELNLVAIKKFNKYFVKEKDSFKHQFSDRYSIFRFDTQELDSFEKDWKVFKSLPTTAERFTKGRTPLLKYELKKGFTPTEKTPQSMSVNEFDGNEDIEGLYTGVYRAEPDEWKYIDMKIELLDADCEPLHNPKYSYVIKFPSYVDKHMIIQHKYPCYIKSKNAFEYITTAVKKNLPGNCFISSNYDFHFVVEMRIEDSDKTLRVVDISTPKFDYGEKINDIHADNYAELEKKMNGLIDSYINAMTAKLKECPICGGSGWVKE